MFGGGFNATKLRAQLKMAASRLQIASNKKTALVKQTMRSVAELLAADQPQEEKARIKAESLVYDDQHIEAYDILMLECELLLERIKLIEFNGKECPPDLVSCIATLMYASTRVDIPELVTIRKQFRSKYGRKFDEAAMANKDGILNERVVTKLSTDPPAAFLVQTYLEKICEQHEVDWSPKMKLSADQMCVPMAPPTGFSVHGASGLVSTTEADTGLRNAEAAAAASTAPTKPSTPTPRGSIFSRLSISGRKSKDNDDDDEDKNNGYNGGNGGGTVIASAVIVPSSGSSVASSVTDTNEHQPAPITTARSVGMGGGSVATKSYAPQPTIYALGIPDPDPEPSVASAKASVAQTSSRSGASVTSAKASVAQTSSRSGASVVSSKSLAPTTMYSVGTPESEASVGRTASIGVNTDVTSIHSNPMAPPTAQSVCSDVSSLPSIPMAPMAPPSGPSVTGSYFNYNKSDNDSGADRDIGGPGVSKASFFNYKKADDDSAERDIGGPGVSKTSFYNYEKPAPYAPSAPQGRDDVSLMSRGGSAAGRNPLP